MSTPAPGFLLILASVAAALVITGDAQMENVKSKKHFVKLPWQPVWTFNQHVCAWDMARITFMIWVIKFVVKWTGNLYAAADDVRFTAEMDNRCNLREIGHQDWFSLLPICDDDKTWIEGGKRRSSCSAPGLPPVFLSLENKKAPSPISGRWRISFTSEPPINYLQLSISDLLTGLVLWSLAMIIQNCSLMSALVV